MQTFVVNISSSKCYFSIATIWLWRHWNDEMHVSVSLLTRHHRSPRECWETGNTDLTLQPVIWHLSKECNELSVNSKDICKTGYNQKGVWMNSISRRKHREKSRCLQGSVSSGIYRHWLQHWRHASCLLQAEGILWDCDERRYRRMVWLWLKCLHTWASPR